ncbi:MAG: hypothetical protein ACFWTK_10900 [Clostridium sp.]
MNNPIPAVIASLRFCGSASTIFSLIEVNVININTLPDIKTAVIPCCHVYPRFKQTLYEKNAVSPIPGANTIGKLA